MSDSKLRSTRFRKEREKTWYELDELISRAERHGIGSLNAEEVERLPRLYRAALSSLSTARSVTLDRNVTQYLESLATRGYYAVYGTKLRPWRAFVEFLSYGFPKSVRDLAGHLSLSTFILFLGAVVAWLLVMQDPQYFFAFVDPGLAGGRDPNATTEFLRQALYSSDHGGGELAVFASFLVSHNAKIGMMCFALGFAAGIPVVYLLFVNGLMLGAFTALYDSHGLSFEFYSWILPHGITEIGAVILCGAAGLAIGRAVSFGEGDYDRVAAVKRAGRRVGPTVIGAVLMFMLAAILEGFFRQMVTDVVVRYAVATATALFWLIYFTMVGTDRG